MTQLHAQARCVVIMSVGLLIGVLSAMACNFPLATLPPRVSPTVASTVTMPPVAAAFIPSALPVLSPVPPTAVPVAVVPTKPRTVPTAVPASKTPAPASQAGCLRPPDDYTRKVVNGEKLNYRTLWMLQQAQQIYNGSIDFANRAITQGSYNPGGVAASFGTHDAGGAVDLSVMNPRNGQVYRTELPAATRALRLAGFAA